MPDSADRAHAPPANVAWWREPTKDQWYAFIAAWLGWTLNAFDFTVFLLIMHPIAQAFNVSILSVTFVFTITLWMRLFGATASGWIGDRIGRKTPPMIAILGYSFCNLAAALAPSFMFLFIARAVLGWGTGFLVSFAVYGLLCNTIGWRGMLIAGVLPALAVFYIRLFVTEPEVWVANRALQRAQKREVKAPLFSIFKRGMIGTSGMAISARMIIAARRPGGAHRRLFRNGLGTGLPETRGRQLTANLVVA